VVQQLSWCLAEGYRNGNQCHLVGPCGLGKILFFTAECRTKYQLHEELCFDSPRRLVLGVTALRQKRVNLVNEYNGWLMHAGDSKQCTYHLLPLTYLHSTLQNVSGIPG